MQGILDPFRGGNRHVVDRLGELRRVLRAGKTLEDDLKKQIMSEMGGDDSMGGDEFIAQQRISERKGGLDEKSLREELGERLELFRKPSSTTVTLATTLRSDVI